MQFNELYQEKLFYERFGELLHTICNEYPDFPEKYLGLPELTLRDSEDFDTEVERDYALWTISADLALSYLNFVPYPLERIKYVCDDLDFDLHIPELNIMMNDVMETYAHCRFQIYTATSYPNPMAWIAYSLSPKADRIYTQEILLDVYPRLYSILDKISHIVMESCGIILSPRIDGYAPQPSYNLIVKEIRNHSGSNPYLLTLCEIFDEINPRFIYKNNEGRPFYSMLPEAEDMDRIRHHIIHSGV